MHRCTGAAQDCVRCAHGLRLFFIRTPRVVRGKLCGAESPKLCPSTPAHLGLSIAAPWTVCGKLGECARRDHPATEGCIHTVRNTKCSALRVCYQVSPIRLRDEARAGVSAVLLVLSASR